MAWFGQYTDIGFLVLLFGFNTPASTGIYLHEDVHGDRVLQGLVVVLLEEEGIS